AEDGIRDFHVTGVQTCALPICADLVVVWATLDKSLGRAAIKSFVVEKGTPGFDLVRLEHKLGIRASDTAHFILSNCRVPKENLRSEERRVGHAARSGGRP